MEERKKPKVSEQRLGSVHEEPGGALSSLEMANQRLRVEVEVLRALVNDQEGTIASLRENLNMTNGGLIACREKIGRLQQLNDVLGRQLEIADAGLDEKCCVSATRCRTVSSQDETQLNQIDAPIKLRDHLISKASDLYTSRRDCELLREERELQGKNHDDQARLLSQARKVDEEQSRTISMLEETNRNPESTKMRLEAAFKDHETSTANQGVRLNQMASELTDTKGANERLRQEKEDLEERCDAAAKLLGDAHNVNEEQSRMIPNLEETNQNLVTAKSQLQADTHGDEASLAKLGRHMVHMARELTDSKGTNERLPLENEAVMTRLDAATTKLADAVKGNADVQSTLDSSDAVAQQHSQVARVLKGRLKMAVREMSVLRGDNHSLRERNERLARQVESITKDLNETRMEDDRRKLACELLVHMYKRRIAEMGDQLDSTMSQLDTSRDDNQNLRAMNDNLGNVLNATRQANVGQRRRIVELEEATDNLTNNLTTAKSDLSKANSWMYKAAYAGAGVLVRGAAPLVTSMFASGRGSPKPVPASGPAHDGKAVSATTAAGLATAALTVGGGLGAAAVYSQVDRKLQREQPVPGQRDPTPRRSPADPMKIAVSMLPWIAVVLLVFGVVTVLMALRAKYRCPAPTTTHVVSTPQAIEVAAARPSIIDF